MHFSTSKLEVGDRLIELRMSDAAANIQDTMFIFRHLRPESTAFFMLFGPDRKLAGQTRCRRFDKQNTAVIHGSSGGVGDLRRQDGSLYRC